MLRRQRCGVGGPRAMLLRVHAGKTTQAAARDWCSMLFVLVPSCVVQQQTVEELLCKRGVWTSLCGRKEFVGAVRVERVVVRG
mmetsp:Transcript_42646/g.68504  ORF Transcript_42646/g.68504 Transcript_42646/m.68504 type:complete len:83 (-) Transcript_42646:428-676(-)